MQFTWDDAKNTANARKHGIRFEEAMLIFRGPFLERPDRRKDYGERRVISVGQVDDLLMLAVVHTDREDVRRIISARRANRKERKHYAAYLSFIGHAADLAQA